MNRRISHRNMMMSSGWLFADLLLGLMVIFLIAVPPQPLPPPTMTINTHELDPTKCTGDIENLTCQLVLGVTKASKIGVTWTATSDMSDNVSFLPKEGSLDPGKTQDITITNIPCQNGSFIFKGSGNATTLIIQWRCTVQEERLDFQFEEMELTVNNINGLFNNSQDVFNDIKEQVRSKPIFANQRSVGLVIAYGGAPDNSYIPQAQQVAGKIYEVFQSMSTEPDFPAFKRSSYYNNLYDLGASENIVQVHVFFYKKATI